MRALAETVWRLVRRDKSQSAVHLISRMLSELDLQRPESLDGAHVRDHEQRSYLLNLRGVIYAQKGQEDAALSDLEAAHREYPLWAVPLYNLGLFHKQAKRWVEATTALTEALACVRRQAGQKPVPPSPNALTPLAGPGSAQLSGGAGLSRAVLWNLGIAQTAQGLSDEARTTWQACGSANGRSGAHTDLGLAQLSLPTQGPYSVERVWVQRLDPARARILSVVRYGAPCQFGDIVLCDSGAGLSGYSDGLVQGEGEDSESSDDSSAGLVFLDALESAGYSLHVVQGGATTPTQAMALTERMREAGLHIEVWSLTMRLPGAAADDAQNPETRGSTPLCAGLVVPPPPGGLPGRKATRFPEAAPLLSEDPQADAQKMAERAVSVLVGAGRDLGLILYAPTLMNAAGDELGAARHRKALRRSASER